MTTKVRRTKHWNAPRFSAQELQAAFELYLTRKLSLDSIAEQLKVSAVALSKVARNENWEERRSRIEEAMVHKFEREVELQIAQNRANVLERHLILTSDLDRHLAGHLRSKKRLKIKDISELAKSVSLSTRVSGAAVGLGEGLMSRPMLVQTITPKPVAGSSAKVIADSVKVLPDPAT